MEEGMSGGFRKAQVSRYQSFCPRRKLTAER